MWHRLTLKVRLFLILGSLAIISSAGSILTVWYSLHTEIILDDLIQKHISGYQTAVSLEMALANQKGFVSYFIQDGDTKWLDKLDRYQSIFDSRLADARRLHNSPDFIDMVAKIDRTYRQYTIDKDRVIADYKAGNIDEGKRLQQVNHERFFQIFMDCEAYKALFAKRIEITRRLARTRSHRLRMAALGGLALSLALALMLAFVLMRQIISPLRQLAALTRHEPIPNPDSDPDLMQMIRKNNSELIVDAGQTHMALEKSRESLAQTEKLALVGKLAAGVAHSVRNPLTSVKMRLFSLDRSLKLSEDQKEDFDVITTEIRHVDNIVQNFLEFARPPKLVTQRISPSLIVDQALQLIEYRMRAFDVNVTLRRCAPLPEVEADPEQIKEVLVNLIVNACEAMANGGTIVITEKNESTGPGAEAIVEITDTGPGIEPSMVDNLFQPFFTTKENGTGLGLSIAQRIVEEHGGRLTVRSTQGEGATFAIALPMVKASPPTPS